MADRAPRILMAEDHLMVGQAFRRVLEPEFQVEGPFGDGRVIADLVADSKPEILLLDLTLRYCNGMEVIPVVRERTPGTAIVVMTMNADPWTMEEALRLGALGFVPKNADGEELLVALRMALRGEVYRSPTVVRSPHPISTGPFDVAVSDLTERRREVFEMIADGHSNDEIARRLGCTRSGVYYYRKEIREHLQFQSDDALNRMAMLWRVRQAAMGQGKR